MTQKNAIRLLKNRRDFQTKRELWIFQKNYLYVHLFTVANWMATTTETCTITSEAAYGRLRITLKKDLTNNRSKASSISSQRKTSLSVMSELTIKNIFVLLYRMGCMGDEIRVFNRWSLTPVGCYSNKKETRDKKIRDIQVNNRVIVISHHNQLLKVLDAETLRFNQRYL